MLVIKLDLHEMKLPYLQDCLLYILCNCYSSCAILLLPISLLNFTGSSEGIHTLPYCCIMWHGSKVLIKCNYSVNTRWKHKKRFEQIQTIWIIPYWLLESCNFSWMKSPSSYFHGIYVIFQIGFWLPVDACLCISSYC